MMNAPDEKDFGMAYFLQFFAVYTFTGCFESSIYEDSYDSTVCSFILNVKMALIVGNMGHTLQCVDSGVLLVLAKDV